MVKIGMPGVDADNFKCLFCSEENVLYICTRFRAISSAGSEHLPYKQRVCGSNP